jgi:hypothetical protein
MLSAHAVTLMAPGLNYLLFNYQTKYQVDFK